jgi:hypothetical protein
MRNGASYGTPRHRHRHTKSRASSSAPRGQVDCVLDKERRLQGVHDGQPDRIAPGEIEPCTGGKRFVKPYNCGALLMVRCVAGECLLQKRPHNT